MKFHFMKFQVAISGYLYEVLRGSVQSFSLRTVAHLAPAAQARGGGGSEGIRQTRPSCGGCTHAGGHPIRSHAGLSIPNLQDSLLTPPPAPSLHLPSTNPLCWGASMLIAAGRPGVASRLANLQQSIATHIRHVVLGECSS